MDIKEALKGKLSQKEIEELKTSFDIIGDIGIIESDVEFPPWGGLIPVFHEL